MLPLDSDNGRDYGALPRADPSPLIPSRKGRGMTCQAGFTFWFRLKKLVGSYFFLSWDRRS